MRVALTATALCAVVGLPVAYGLARWRSRWAGVIEAMLILPMVLPPTVVGYGLMVLLGRRSAIGAWLDEVGVPVLFTVTGAVIAATVVAFPLLVLPSRAAFASLHREVFGLAELDGLGPVATFWQVALPVASRGAVAGTLLCFARALGEFGATLMVAGNIPGRTMTLPLSVYTAIATGDESAALGPVLLLVAISIAVVGGSQLLLARRAVR